MWEEPAIIGSTYLPRPGATTKQKTIGAATLTVLLFVVLFFALGGFKVAASFGYRCRKADAYSDDEDDEDSDEDAAERRAKKAHKQKKKAAKTRRVGSACHTALPADEEEADDHDGSD